MINKLYELNDKIGISGAIDEILIIDDMINSRKMARENKEWKVSDEIRNNLDEKLVFVFDMKDKNGKQYQEVHYLNDDYFNHIYTYKDGSSETQMEKIERQYNIKFKTKREFLEWNIKQNIASEKRADAWLYSMNSSK